MSLIKQLNESATEQATHDVLVEKNINALLESAGVDIVQLDEAVTQWVAKLRNAIGKGRVDPNKKGSIVNILGSLMAMSDEDVADALDEKGDMGSLLDAIGGADKQLSNAALKRLVELGRHPSIKSYVARANEIVSGDPNEAAQALKKVQMSLDQVMRRKMQQERPQKMGDPRLKMPLSGGSSAPNGPNIA